MDSTIVKWVQSHLVATALVAHRRNRLVLAIATVVTLVASVGAARLEIDADLSELLPKSLPSVRDLAILSDRFGGVGYAVVVLQSEDGDALKKAAEELTPKLEALDSVAWIEKDRPLDFFEQRALYFLDVDDLESIRDTLTERYDFEKRTRNPLYLDLEDEEPPSVEFLNLQEKYQGDGDTTWLRSQAGDPYYYSDSANMLLLFAKPKFTSIDLARAKGFVSEVRKVVATINLTDYSQDMTSAISGRYARKVEQQELIESDLAKTTGLALFLVFIYLTMHFRRVFAVVLVMSPLCMGLLWTYGSATLIFGRLNILTACVGVILLGIGIDHGIHLLGRFESERSGGADEEEAIKRTFGDTGRAVGIAALTTMVGFASLSLSQFRPFKEFGILAAVGVACVVLAYAFVLPALLGLADSFGWKPAKVAEARTGFYLSTLRRHGGRILWVALPIIALLTFNIRELYFDYDLRNLSGGDLPSFKLEEQVNAILGYKENPVCILTSSSEEERVIVDALRAKQASLGDATTIDFIASSVDLVPQNQEAKAPIIADIGTIVRKVKKSWVPKEYRQNFGKAKKMVASSPYTKDDLPDEINRQFKGINAKANEGFILVFPDISQHIGSEVIEFADEVRGIELPDGGVVSASGEEMILADVINMIKNEGLPVLGLTLISVLLTLMILLRNVRDALLTFFGALVTLTGMLGLMPLVGLQINYLNIVMIPVLFGIAVDGVVHIMVRLRSGDNFDAAIADTGRAISGAILTTCLGFGALTMATHPGLVTLAKITILGLLVNLLVCLLVLPAYLAWRRQSHAEPTTAEG